VGGCVGCNGLEDRWRRRKDLREEEEEEERTSMGLGRSGLVEGRCRSLRSLEGERVGR